jgi:hypothetical protein
MKHPTFTLAGMAITLFAASVIFVSGLFVGGVPAAHAADCGITTKDIAKITAIENDPTLSYSDETKAELALRKQLVGQTITCAEQEVRALQARLASTTVSSDIKPLQSQLAGNLKEALGFYDTQSQQLDVVGVAGTKNIAQSVLSWRASTFLPLSENVNNMILWTQNQNLFTTAQTRMTQTQRAVAFLQTETPNTEMQAAFNDTQSSFTDAQSENAAAKTALIKNFAPDETLALIQQSLSSLSDTYQGFSNVSAVISKILP